MRTDLYKDKTNPNEGFDQEYITKLIKYGNEYICNHISPIKSIATMDERIHDLFDSIKNRNLSETDFKYVLLSFTNGRTFHPRRLNISFDVFNPYVTFDPNNACYISLDEENMVNYLADQIERKDFEEWLEKKQAQDNADNTNEEEALLKEIEEE